MADSSSYWDDWAVAEREAMDRAHYGATAVSAADMEPVASEETIRARALYQWDNSPLVAASATGNITWVNELLAAGADVNELSYEYEYLPLIVAAQKGHTEVVKTLLMTAACDLKKKHLNGYINALDSALFGYNNFEGVDDDYKPEIRAMIIRAHMETADRIDLDTLLHIEASCAVTPERIRAFRSNLGTRNTRLYPKATPGEVDLYDPPPSKVAMILNAAKQAAATIAAQKTAAAVSKKKRNVGINAACSSRFNTVTTGSPAGGCGYGEDDETDDRDRHPMFRKRVSEFDPSLDDTYGKMARRFHY
jgi:hypothetical protein